MFLEFRRGIVAKVVEMARPIAMLRFAFGAITIHRGVKFGGESRAAVVQAGFEMRCKLRAELFVNRVSGTGIQIVEQTARRTFQFPSAFFNQAMAGVPEAFELFG